MLRQELASATTVLEIGSGSGQHALFMAENLPHLKWLPSEKPELVDDLQQNISSSHLGNISEPISIDVNRLPWNVSPVSAIFSANTLHIMSLESVSNFFVGIGDALMVGGKLCVYGPFRYKGDFTTLSNAQFDRWLKEQDPVSGIRDFELLEQRAARQGLKLMQDHQMPSNNQLLVWQKC